MGTRVRWKAGAKEEARLNFGQDGEAPKNCMRQLEKTEGTASEADEMGIKRSLTGVDRSVLMDRTSGANLHVNVKFSQNKSRRDGVMGRGNLGLWQGGWDRGGDFSKMGMCRAAWGRAWPRKRKFQ